MDKRFSEHLTPETKHLLVLQELKGKRWHVLDQGFVTLVDVMGNDSAIEDAARISYGSGTRKASKTRGLLRYLMRHRHTTPFEMAELKFHVRVPMDCWRQWIRHRTANVNEYSTRYSEAIDARQCTLPEGWRSQSKSNKQGGDKYLPIEKRDCSVAGFGLTSAERELHKTSQRVYQERLDAGVAREQARKDLPLSTYTEAFWKIDLHNMLHFLSLRMDSHAQYEIRQYATIMGNEIVAKLFPLTWEAFCDYRLDAMHLTAIDIKVITGQIDVLEIENKRERDECLDKLTKLNLPRPTALEIAAVADQGSSQRR